MATTSPRLPLVSIVTLNLDQTAVTLELVRSLAVASYPQLEVIVVDNGSQPAAAAALRRGCAAAGPRFTFVRSPRNLGFTGGNNLGIEAACGELVLLLNNDTEVEPGFLEPLVDAMLGDPGVGIASPKIRYFGERERIQYAGCSPLHPLTGRSHATGAGEIDRGQHDVVRETAFGHGAAMLVRREVFEQVGLLHDPYFIYYEELDLNERARRGGWRTLFVGTSTVFHKVSTTVGKASPLKARLMARNRVLWLRRNGRGAARACALAWTILVATPAAVLRHLAARRADLAAAHLRGIVAGLTAPPRPADPRLPPATALPAFDAFGAAA